MDSETVDKAVAAIKAADLTPIEHLILLDFVDEAYQPSLTARLVLDRIRNDDRPVEETLRVLKEEWHELVAVISRPTPFDASAGDLVARRDRSRCCVTPSDRQQLDAPEPTFIIPPAISELVEVKESYHSSKSLLDAFMTPSRAARLLSMVSDRSDSGILANALLLTPSIQFAFTHGHLQVRISSGQNWNSIDEDADTDDLQVKYVIFGMHPEPYRDIVLADRSSFHDNGHTHYIRLQTENSKELPLPNPFLLKTHFKFSQTLHRFYVEERIAEGWGHLQPPSFFSRNTQLVIRTIWQLIPKFFREAGYRRLLENRIEKLGKDSDFTLYFYDFPFGLQVKCIHSTDSDEPNTLRVVERCAPSIPAPLLIDTFHHRSFGWMITIDPPGRPASRVLHRMSYPERNQLAADLCDVIAQLHKIPNTTPYRFANVSGGPIHDHRLDSGVTGPFNNEADLHTALAGGSRRQSYVISEVPGAYSRMHDSVFTHGQLYATNLLVDGGRLTGILDWDCAAFMPTYWECAKAMRPFRYPIAQEIYRKMWGDEFEVELEAERWIWKTYPWWS